MADSFQQLINKSNKSEFHYQTFTFKDIQNLPTFTIKMAGMLQSNLIHGAHSRGIHGTIYPSLQIIAIQIVDMHWEIYR